MMASPPQTVVEAERAFAADAQKLGQWAAFRKWAAPDATMFVPQPVAAQDWLMDRAEPAKAIEWWPTAAWVSCDGTLAVDTGGWNRPDGSVGFFSTIWSKQSDRSWRWVLDGGDTLPVARPNKSHPRVRHGECGAPRRAGYFMDHDGSGWGMSPDRTLIWAYTTALDRHREFSVKLWDGVHYVDVIADRIAAPKP